MSNDLKSKEKRLFLVDAYGFVFRAYHVLPPMNSPDGTPSGAVYGFTNMMMKQVRDHLSDGDGNYFLVVFDSGRKSFRDEIYSEYKANRPPAPEDLIPQFPILREATNALGLASVETDGYEADDLIATYAKLAKSRGYKVTIISSDKDLMQLVDDDVQMYDAMKDKKIGIDQVKEKFGVPPEKVLDVLSLMGDSSDNIPGVPGIGPKTAAELINEYGSLDNLLNCLDQIKQNKRRETLISNKENAILSKRLASLAFDAPVNPDMEQFAIHKPDEEKLFLFLQKYGFKSLLTRLGKKPAESLKEVIKEEAKILPQEIVKKHEIIEDKNQLDEWLKDVETNSKLIIFSLKGKGIALSKAPGIACFVPSDPTEKPKQDLFDFGENKTLNSSLCDAIYPFFTNEYVLKIGHDIKPEIRIREIKPYEDTMVMSYVLDGTKNKHDLITLSKLHLNIDLPGPKDEITPESACLIADCIIRLNAIFRQRLFNEKLLTVYDAIERPMIAVLARMENAGIKVSVEELGKLSQDFTARINNLEKEIYSLAGREFNIGSPKQLGQVLFEEMNIPGGKISAKSGAYSTGADVLEELSAQGHTIAQKILEWREFSKLRSTYTDALQAKIDPVTKRIHTTFLTTIASTGRLSSVEPNLQNIPIRSEEGRKIRKAFTVDNGNRFISADYSQIEIRLLAHYADIATLKQAFKEGKDIHAATASQVFGVPIDQVDANMRRSAKTINFGIIYGQSAFGLANQLGIGRREAQTYIDAYFQQYPGIKKYMEDTKVFAREHGYVKTYYGRKCFLAGIKDRNAALRAFAERAAINAPLQGTAADIIKKAMIKIDRQLIEKNFKTRMLLQVHDELIFEAPENESEQIQKLVKKEMENVITLSVPIIADVKIGQNWGECH